MGVSAESTREGIFSRKHLAACTAALVCLTAFAHIDGLDGAFLDWDDSDHVTENSHIRTLDLSTLYWAFTSVDRHNWQPLSWLSFATDFALYGEHPRGFHLTNLILHCLNVLWVFALACALFPLVRGQPNENRANSKHGVVLASFLGAALFGVHPQHVESVAWISERRDVLFLFFYLPSLIAYLRYSAAGTPELRRFWYLASLAAFVLSILSKPMAVSLPIVLLLLDVYPLRRTATVRVHRLGFEKLPFVAVSLLSAAMTLRAQWTGMNPAETNTPLLRTFTASDGLAAYVRHWALPLDLSPHYAFRFALPGEEASFASYSLVLLFVIGTTLVAGGLWLRGTRAPLASWAFYTITLLPVLGVVSVGSASHADRYAYLPTLPLHLGFGLLAAGTILSERLPRLGKLAAGLLVVVVLATMTHLTKLQTRIWKDDVTLWNHALTLAPQDFATQLHAAHAHVLIEDFETAARHFRLAFELQPGAKSHPFLSTMSLVSAQVLFRLENYAESAAVLGQIEGGAPVAPVQDLHQNLAIQFCLNREPRALAEQLDRFAALRPSPERLDALENQLRALDCSAN